MILWFLIHSSSDLTNNSAQEAASNSFNILNKLSVPKSVWNLSDGFIGIGLQHSELALLIVPDYSQDSYRKSSVLTHNWNTEVRILNGASNGDTGSLGRWNAGFNNGKLEHSTSQEAL